MMTHWTIKMLNAVFVWSLGATVFWLFCHAFVTDRAKKKAPVKGMSFLLNIFRDGVPYLKIPLKNKRYSIGRDTCCDIPIRGIGIPPVIGEMCPDNDNFIFRTLIQDHESTGALTRDEQKIIKPGHDLLLYNYVLRIETN